MCVFSPFLKKIFFCIFFPFPSSIAIFFFTLLSAYSAEGLHNSLGNGKSTPSEY